MLNVEYLLILHERYISFIINTFVIVCKTMGNADYIEEIQRKTQEEEKRNEKESRWMKPAKDIITGIEKSSAVVPERPIWELVQNARDLAKGKANINFIRRDKEFDFSHDGESFTDKTIRGLITQTSTKLRDDKSKVGQYGTGFLTTHRFGRSFELSGALYTSEGSEYFYNFKKFKINRRALNEPDMMDALERQISVKESFKTKYAPVKVPEKTTLFRYTQDAEDEENNVKLAFQDAQKYVPYVLSLNSTIQSISFIDEKDEYFIRYNKKGDPKLIEENLWVQTIAVSTDDVSLNKEVNIYLLKSTEFIEGQESKFTIILPQEKTKAIKLPEDMARLFLYLPLIGTNEFGADFIINSPVFECEENRNQLWLDGTAEAIKKKIENNRNILSEATNLLLSYCDDHIEKIEDAINWFRIYFTVNMKGSDDYKEYISSIQLKWVDKFKDYEVVQLNNNDEEKGKPSEIIILDRSIIDLCEANNDFFTDLYKIIELYYLEKLPSKKCIIEWSKIIEEWYEGIEQTDFINKKITVKSILQHIDENSDIISPDNYDSLIYLYSTIIKEGYSPEFKDKKLIPSINNVFFDADELLLPKDLTTEIISIISGFLQGEVDRFVHDKFASLQKYIPYSQETIENDIKIYITNKNKNIEEAEKLLEKYINLDDKEELELRKRISVLLIPLGERNSLFEFCNYVIKANSDSFFRTVIESMIDFYDYNYQYTVNAAEEFEYRLVFRCLLRNTFLDLTIREYDWGNDKTQKDKLVKLLKTVQDYEDFKKLNNNARLYLSKKGKLHLVKFLDKESDITSDLKRIYKEVIGKDIDDDLVDDDFLECYDYSDSICSASDLASEIDSKIQDEKFPDIRNNQYKDILIELTEKITEESDLEEEYKIKQMPFDDKLRYWSLLFKDIAREKEHITMFKIRQPELKQSMFRIMRASPERVQLLARLATMPRLEEIVESGEKALFDKKNRDFDFNFKNTLGKYIEDFLKKELDKEFSNITFEYQEYDDVVTKNQQGGQDIIIKKGGEEIFFIEVKSRWSNKPSVTMSPLQMDISVDHQDKYALCAVNMYASNLEEDAMQKEEDDRNNKEHIYPPFAEIEPRIRVLLDIGKRNERLLEQNNKLKTDADNAVTLTGDYRARVPQKLLNSNDAVNFNILLQEIKKRIQSI